MDQRDVIVASLAIASYAVAVEGVDAVVAVDGDAVVGTFDVVALVRCVALGMDAVDPVTGAVVRLSEPDCYHRQYCH